MHPTFLHFNLTSTCIKNRDTLALIQSACRTLREVLDTFLQAAVIGKDINTHRGKKHKIKFKPEKLLYCLFLFLQLRRSKGLGSNKKRAQGRFWLTLNLPWEPSETQGGTWGCFRQTPQSTYSANRRDGSMTDSNTQRDCCVKTSTLISLVGLATSVDHTVSWNVFGDAASMCGTAFSFGLW